MDALWDTFHARRKAEVFFTIKTKVLSSSNGDPDFMGLLNKDDIYEDRIGCRAE